MNSGGALEGTLWCRRTLSKLPSDTSRFKQYNISVLLIPARRSNITLVFRLCTYAYQEETKQQPYAMETPSASPAREANANASIMSNDDIPLAAMANTEASVILAALNDMSTRMEDRFNNLGASLQATQATLTEHDARISTVEAASIDHDIRLTGLKQQWLQLEVPDVFYALDLLHIFLHQHLGFFLIFVTEMSGCLLPDIGWDAAFKLAD